MCPAKIEIQEKKGCLLKFNLKAPPEDFQMLYQVELVSLQKKAKVPGFRPGKVPIEIIQSRFGRDIVNETFDKYFPAEFIRICRENGWYPVTDPRVGNIVMKRNKPLTCDVAVEILPDFKMKSYKKLKLTKKVMPVSEKDVDKIIEDIREKTATFEDIKEIRPVTQDDFIVIDFEGFIDGKPLENAAMKNFPIDMSKKSFIQDFQRQLVGLLPCKEYELDVKFPDYYHAKDLSGKTAKFKVTIVKIRKKILPPINSEWIKKVSEFTDIDSLKGDIKKHITDERKRIEEEELRQDLLNVISETYEQFDLPNSMVAERTQHRLYQFDDDLRKKGGKGLDDYIKDSGKDIEAIVKEIKPYAEKDVRINIILSRIGREENITVSDEEIATAIEEMKRKSKEDEIDYNKYRRRIAEGILHDKTINFLIISADIKEEKTVVNNE